MSEKTNGNGSLNGWRTQAMYTFSEAAHLAHVSPGTVRNWLLGNQQCGRPPLFNAQENQGPMVSFLQLIEIMVAGNFRKAEHVSFDRVRRAYANAQRIWHLEYPFAHLRLQAIGGHVVRLMHEDAPDTSFQAVDEPGQWTIPGLVIETILQLEYEQDFAAKWYPVGKQVPIVVDPRISSGLPTIIGRGVTVQAIRARFKANQKIDFIAQDFALDRSVIEEAIRYADQVAA